MSDDERKGSDSIAALGTALSGSARARRALLWIGTVAGSAALSWIAAKVDTKLDIQHEVREQLESRASLELQRHTEVMGAIRDLDDRLLSKDVNAPGKVVVLEQGSKLAFRALSELRAIALTAEPPRTRAAKESQGSKAVRSFNGRKGLPQDVYAELVDEVAIP